MSLNSYGNDRPCTSCADEGTQVWIDTWPGSITEGLCSECGLEKRGLIPPRGKDAITMSMQHADQVTRMETMRKDFEAETLALGAKLNALRTVAVTAANYQAFGKALQDIKGAWKLFDDREKQMNRPSLDWIKSVREVCSPPKKLCEELEAVIKEKMSDYVKSESAASSAALETAQAAAASGDVEGAQAALATMASAGAPKVDGVSMVPVWKFEVKDIEMLPTEYKLPNLKMIEAEKKRQLEANPEAAPNFPGVRFFPDLQVRSASTK